MEKKRWIMILALLLPVVNLILYIPNGMYNAAVVGIGSIGANSRIEISDFLRTAYDLRLYIRYISGALLFLWGWCFMQAKRDQAQRIIGTGTFLVCLLVRLLVHFGNDWMFEYYAAIATDLLIWQGFSFFALLYAWGKPLRKTKTS